MDKRINPCHEEQWSLSYATSSSPLRRTINSYNHCSFLHSFRAENQRSPTTKIRTSNYSNANIPFKFTTTNVDTCTSLTDKRQEVRSAHVSIRSNTESITLWQNYRMLHCHSLQPREKFSFGFFIERSSSLSLIQWSFVIMILRCRNFSQQWWWLKKPWISNSTICRDWSTYD